MWELSTVPPSMIPNGEERAEVGGAQIYEYFLPMRWDGIEREFPDQVFGMLTVYELPEEKSRQLVNAGPDESSPELPPAGIWDSESNREQSFALEKHLEEFIVSNFHRVFNGKLEISRDSEGFTGQQYRTDVGIIDILARDKQTGDYVVIELKRGQASDATVGQILRYMGWVREHLCIEPQGVQGIVICQEADDRLEYALSMMPNVGVKFYQIEFRLMDSPGYLGTR